MSHDPYWHEREPSMCAGCEREHYERRRAEEECERAAYEDAAAPSEPSREGENNAEN